MKLNARCDGRDFELEVRRQNGLYVVSHDGREVEVDAHKLEGDFYSLIVGGSSYEVSVEPLDNGYRVRAGGTEQHVTLAEPGRSGDHGAEAMAGPERIVSVMPGKVVRVLVREGEAVEAGQGVVVVSAMKMENEIAAGRSGSVQEVRVREGEAVEAGTVLVVVG